MGLDAEEYRAELAVDSGWTGMAELDVTVEEMDRLYEDGRVEHPAAAELPCHTGLVLQSERGSGLGRVGADKQVRLVRGDRDAFGLHGRSPPSSGSRSTCCWTPTSGSSRSAVAPAPASPRWPCAPASRP